MPTHIINTHMNQKGKYSTMRPILYNRTNMNLISQHAIRPARINYIHTHKQGQHASPRPTCNSMANTHQQNQYISTRTHTHQQGQHTSHCSKHIHKANTHPQGKHEPTRQTLNKPDNMNQQSQTHKTDRHGLTMSTHIY